MLSLLCLLVCAHAASGFYLPGVAPRDYQKGDAIGVKVVKLDSIKTQLPYDYYSLPFCKPPVIEETAEGLGEVLSGDRMENSMYKVSRGRSRRCLRRERRQHCGSGDQDSACARAHCAHSLSYAFCLFVSLR